MRIVFCAVFLSFFISGCAEKTLETPTTQDNNTTTQKSESYAKQSPEVEPEGWIEEKNPYTQKPKNFETIKPTKTNKSRDAVSFAWREKIIQSALHYKGKKDGGDCSGFVNLINDKNGYPYYFKKELDAYYDNARKSRAMYNLMRKNNRAYFDKEPVLGDLVFFANTARTSSKIKVPKSHNITHVGIVTQVDNDGTVHFIHHSNGKNVIDYMNPYFPNITLKDGKKINTYMKRCPSKKGIVNKSCLNLAFFVGYGSAQEPKTRNK
ncbi:MAG: hypothetical protein PHN38_07015 [Sulfurospirillaceae bacterium]|nr:hypothetical protein [Sulfurospirillaceae bacterium]MDD3463192.1 hypothetical protein [Sulfurospirillaceae bacterium]